MHKEKLGGGKLSQFKSVGESDWAAPGGNSWDNLMKLLPGQDMCPRWGKTQHVTPASWADLSIPSV